MPLAACLLALLAAPVASAEEPPADTEAERARVSTSFTDDLEVRYWTFDDELLGVPVYDYVEQVNRLNAHADVSHWSLDLQVDEVALFANRYYLDDVLYVERELTVPELWSPLPGDAYANVEKVRVEYEKGPLLLSLGDSYAAFGRGIALNLNRNVDIDLDTSVQGVKVVGRPGAWDLTAVAGQLNRQQVFMDNPNIELYGDLRHSVAGVRAERFGLGPANLGAHGVIYDFTTEVGLEAGFRELETPPDVFVAGATAELIGVGGVDWFVEGDVFEYADGFTAGIAGEEDELGYALYGSASFYPGPFVFLIEGKRYYQAERVNALLTPELYEVAVAPTLEYERAITEDSSAAINSNDIYGGRIQVDWTAIPGGVLVPYVALAAFRDLAIGQLNFNPVPETILHPMGGFEYIRDEGAALVNFGYRLDDRDGTDRGADRQLHGDAAIKVPVPLGMHADFAVGAEYFQWGNNEPFQQSDYVEIESAVTLSPNSWLAVTWFTDYTTNPLVTQNTSGNLTDNLYGAAELQVKPTSGLTMKAFAGAYKAGIRCSGGQCRTLPAFEGVRFSMVGSF